MLTRNTVLVVDSKGDISDPITTELRKCGYHTVCVGELDAFLPLLESRDRIYTIVFVDRDSSTETRRDKIRALKQLAPGVPIVFVATMSTSEMEKEVRGSGVFFYHVNGDGMKVLIEAVRAAVEDAIVKDSFIPSFHNQ